ncbi:hypothetical protein [Archangium sp.]|uniref:hypothetical protein n=1 Tax=Archangium sp. TaxID=1872627 RepID=UPI002D320B23|nr:hypothetical protein [Archangium sp.]HYO52291.1 hypothetical protein [Archangium sp.]
MRLTRAPPGRERYLARLERVVDESSAERAPELLPVMRLVEGGAPAPPDRVDVRLTPRG